MARTSKKKKEHYVNNKEFLAAMVDFRNNVQLAEKNGDERPRVTPYIGECLMKIAVHLSHKPNFINYTFKEEMISDGIENCLQYIDNFNPEKSQNPFAYFTQIIYYAFLRRIQKEKKHLYTKYKLTDEVSVMGLDRASQDHDTDTYVNSKTSEWSREHVDVFIESFEESKRRKKNRNTTAVDLLINE
tara:strand:+ start:3187 stop:3747 length:561 start_codon:yes stop_codon:yes gene_type:complete